jgi:hypothetical protein
MKAFDIVGYSWNAENYTPGGLIEAMIANGQASPAARDMDTEEVLDQIANANAIDRYNERSYDSAEFPKVIFASDVEEGETFLDADGNYVDIDGNSVSEFGNYASYNPSSGQWDSIALL